MYELYCYRNSQLESGLVHWWKPIRPAAQHNANVSRSNGPSWFYYHTLKAHGSRCEHITIGYSRSLILQTLSHVLVRWNLRLSELDSNVVYRVSTKHKAVDALSGSKTTSADTTLIDDIILAAMIKTNITDSIKLRLENYQQFLAQVVEHSDPSKKREAPTIAESFRLRRPTGTIDKPPIVSTTKNGRYSVYKNGLMFWSDQSTVLFRPFYREYFRSDPCITHLTF